ncbi:hypothetical protein DEFDS_0027 [Deferribacter desulfuricans SSM1]|uniref:Uncharacterized protein n=1 Tax=Deferribacter desulfuricans (strain DSM 14783 / JCM 11476 / NBRC 101012 / SSM1) TaxID=639282 RepID=D3PAB6_DEFDS|nr:hypothetical protein [Deferribacter desulfuricans]BAI79539.1 hypothetical protein DEFDS_0027 [Deferribacter desulfuricans SSM1]
MIKPYIKITLLLLIIFNSAFGDNSQPIKRLFPDISKLEGGENRWLTTAFIEEKSNQCYRLNKKYTYFGDNETVILDIKRKKVFKVDVDLYFCKNGLIANEIYENLLKSINSLYKQDIAVGDKGVIFADKIGQGFNANYTLLFVMNNFLVKIKSDDGFALVDFADYLEKSINSFIYNNLTHYLSDTVTLTFIKDGYISKKKEINIGNSLKNNIEIDGYVFDYKEKPIDNVNIKVENLGLVAKTDQNGFFRLKLDLGKKQYKLIKTKTFLEKIDLKDKNVNPLVYIKLINNNLYQNFLIDAKNKSVFIKVDNSYKLINTYNFSKHENRISFLLKCGEGVFNDCMLGIDFEIKGSGDVEGSWNLKGKKGVVSGVVLTKTEKTASKLSEYCDILKFKGDLEGQIVESTNELQEEKTLNMLYLDCSKIKKDYFLKSLTIRFPFNEKGAKIPLYSGSVESLNYILYDLIDYFKIIDNFATLSISKDNVGDGKYIVVIPEELRDLNVENSEIVLVKYDDNINLQAGKINSYFSHTNKDIVSFKNQITKDGKKDELIIVSFENVVGLLTDIEIVSEGLITLKWNLDPYDVYPAIAVFEKGKFLGNKINIQLDGFSKQLDLYFAGSNLMDKDKTFVILTINGEKYKVKVNNGD